MSFSQLTKVDARPVPSGGGEIRLFLAVKNEVARLPYFFEYYRSLGVDRFFAVDNLSTDGTGEFLDAQQDCHHFVTAGQYFTENVSPPSWTNALANVFGDGHWSITVDADELLVYPHCETLGLRELCGFLEMTGAEGLFAPMIDMYGAGPIAASTYKSGASFIDANPWHDPSPGWIKHVDGQCPPIQMFGGVRERVFWKGRFRSALPPCISKVPLIRWRKGMQYIVSMHFHSGAVLSELRGALLHFKFLAGFQAATAESLQYAQGIVEKGLGERVAYNEALIKNPDLALWNSESVKYSGTDQLVKQGWLKTSQIFESHVQMLKLDRRHP